MSYKWKKLIYILVLAVITIPSLAQAANLKDAFKGRLDSAGNASGYDTSSKTIEFLNQDIVSTILSFVGIIFIIIIIYAGTSWLSAGGSEEKIQKAKKIMTQAIIGLAITLAAYLIAWTITNFLAAPDITLPNY